MAELTLRQTQNGKKHQKAIEALTSPDNPFTNCLNSFADLYDTDPVRAEEIADECLKFIKTKSS